MINQKKLETVKNILWVYIAFYITIVILEYFIPETLIEYWILGLILFGIGGFFYCWDFQKIHSEFFDVLWEWILYFGLCFWLSDFSDFLGFFGFYINF